MNTLVLRQWPIIGERSEQRRHVNLMPVRPEVVLTDIGILHRGFQSNGSAAAL